MRRVPFRFISLAVSLFAAAFLASLPSSAALAQNAADARKTTYLIPVDLPLQSQTTEKVKRIVDGYLDHLEKGGPRAVLIFEFKPSEEKSDGMGSNFAAAHELARLLTSEAMSRVETVAFVPVSIGGHALLPVLACERIVMARGAELIDAGADEPNIDGSIVSVYEHIAKRRNTIPRAIAQGLVDKRMKIYWVKAPEVKFVGATELDELKTKGLATEIETLKNEGEPMRLSGKQMRETFRFVSNLADNRRELETQFQVPSGSLEPDPTRGETPRAVLVNLSGTTSGTSWIQRAIDDEIRNRKVNLVILRIDSAGGNITDSLALAYYLAQLSDAEVRTVAFIPDAARSDAALIAMACDHVVVTPSATMGGPGATAIDDTIRQPVLDAIRKVMERNSRRWSIPQAMLDPSAAVHSYRNSDSGLTEFFNEEEVQAQADPKLWQKGEPVTRAGEQLSLVGDRAQQLGVAKFVVESFEQLKGLYNLKEDPLVVQPNWAHRVIEGLADPRFAFILVFVGGAALIVEMKTPGVGVGAFTAGVCFLLFFWGQILRGNADYLEVMLFIAGLLCLALEVFALPGAMIFGFGGAALIVASLILATQTFILPRNSYELSQVPISLFMVLAAGTGVLVSFYAMGRLLPHTPMLNNLLLKPPGEDQTRRESIVDFSDLLGQTGVTTSLLSPSGKGRFGNRVVDVLSQGELVAKGTPVTVVEVLGNKVIVARTEDAGK